MVEVADAMVSDAVTAPLTEVIKATLLTVELATAAALCTVVVVAIAVAVSKQRQQYYC